MFRTLISFTTALALSGCMSSSAGSRSEVSVGYYNVKGTSFEELDKEIALHGPVVSGVGKAIASTRVRMLPDIRYDTSAGKCRVSSAKIRVRADITLPRLTDRGRVDRKLGRAFSNIEEYARQHEAVHVQIAEDHAAMAEERILRLPAQQSCESLSAQAASVFRKVMEKHEAAQLAFDEQERRRFASS